MMFFGLFFIYTLIMQEVKPSSTQVFEDFAVHTNPQPEKRKNFLLPKNFQLSTERINRIVNQARFAIMTEDRLMGELTSYDEYDRHCREVEKSEGIKFTKKMEKKRRKREEEKRKNKAKYIKTIFFSFCLYSVCLFDVTMSSRKKKNY